MAYLEEARIQFCDQWFNHFTGYGIPGCEGTCAVHVPNRRNDAERWPALGCSVDPGLSIVMQLQTWILLLSEGWTFIINGREKRKRPAAVYLLCQRKEWW